MGIDWTLSVDRVGGRAHPAAHLVIAADPRYAEEYRHELAHVLLQPLVTGTSSFVTEGIAYWLGGARGMSSTATIVSLAGFLSRQPSATLQAILSPDANEALASMRFPAAAVLFQLAFQRAGDAGVREFIRSLGANDVTAERVATALQMPLADVEAQFQSHLRKATTNAQGDGQRR